MTQHKCAKEPCGTCPYRRDVPSGIWSEYEYTKLPDYDGPLYAQPQALFMCHQNDGHLCGGWVAVHGPDNLLAVRLGERLYHSIDPSVFEYKPKAKLWVSGMQACAHGLRGIAKPSLAAMRKIAKLELMRQKRRAKEKRKGEKR